MKRVLAFDPSMSAYQNELQYARSNSDLSNFQALVRYLRSHFHEQLTEQEEQLA